MPAPVIAVARGAAQAAQTAARAGKAVRTARAASKAATQAKRAKSAESKRLSGLNKSVKRTQARKEDAAEGRRKAMTHMGKKNQQEITRMQKSEKYKASGQNPFRNPYEGTWRRQLQGYVNASPKGKK